MSASGPHDRELDPRIVEGLRRRDEEAIVALYEAMSGAVYGYLLNQTKDPSWSQDLTADVFCEVLESADRFEGTPAGLRAWVFRIARNTMIDHFRRQSYRRHDSVDEAHEAGRLPAAPNDPEEDAIGRLERERILALTEELSSDQREVLLLRLVADLPVAEVAGILGKSEGAVKALQHRAVRAMADKLDGTGRNLPEG